MRRLLVLLAAGALALGACSPPAALRRVAGQDGVSEAAPIPSDVFPAPQIPRPPAQLLFGTVVLSNEPGWSKFFNRGQLSGGALVLEVLPNTPASALGLVPGDVISWIDGQDVHNHEQLLVAFRDSAMADHRMRVKRVDGTTIDIETQLVPPAGFMLLDYLEQKLSVGPDPITRYLLAEQMPDADRAIDLLRVLVAEHPDFAEGHALLARRLLDKVEQEAAESVDAIFQSTEEIQELTTAIDRAIELDPEAPSIYRARSQIHLTLGDGFRAEADASRALEMDESSAETHYLLGTSQLTLGNYVEAVERLHLAVELNPFEPRYYINLALCYRSLGREPDAQSTFAAARTLVADPGVLQRLDEIAANQPNV
ncbi:MAG: tetratricopeptide repeat protein [Actinomycetota bacterium]